MSKNQIHTLRFVNLTAGTENTLRVDGRSITSVMAWYGAYYAGDDYGVTVDDQPVSVDQNGEHDPNSDLARLLNLT